MTSGDILKLNGTEVSEDVIKHLVTCHIAPLGMNGWPKHRSIFKRWRRIKK